MDVPKDDTDTATTHPVVVLGAPSPAASGAAQRRALRGRVNARWFVYPVYGLVVGSGGIVCLTIWTTREWAMGPVILAWGVLLVWCRLYTLTWRYRRRILGGLTVVSTFALHLVLIAATWERAGAKALAGHHRRLELTEHAWSPGLGAGAVMLGLSLVLLLLHWAWFGRGWREKRVSSGGGGLT